MNDFFKIKVGFTIGLVAAVLAFKPLADAYSDLGFSIFEIKITVGRAYLFLVGFLVLAVYFISLQFASSKHINFLDKASNACYSIALATPPVFIVFWMATSFFSYFGFEELTNFLVGMLTSIFAIFVYRFFQKSIREKFVAAEKAEERKADIEQLHRAQELLKSGMYDMSVLESSKVLESTLRSLLSEKGIKIRRGGIHELVILCKQHNILDKNKIDILNEIKNNRNKSVHMMDAIDESTADRVLNLSRELILKLDSMSISSAYKWLEKNSEEVLNLFKEGSLEKCKLPIKMLREAWRNRDGAIWLELSEFFEIALIHKPELIVRMFAEDEELLVSWLKSVEGQLFTDFFGDDVQRLRKIQETIVSALEQYLDSENIPHQKNIAQKILRAIKDSKIREID